MAQRGELPTHVINVRTYRDSVEKVDRKLLRLFGRQPFEDAILQPSEPFRQSQFGFVRRMVVAFERATDRTPMRSVPARTLNDFIGSVVRGEARNVFSLDGRIVVKCLHIITPL